jgi:hypothetical protein
MILNSPYITGSITVTGNANVQGTLTVTGSLSGTATSASYAYTASSAINATSASYAYTASSAINAFSASKAISSSYADTASYANNLTVMGNLTVFGTQSVQYITSSQLNVANNIINVNVGTPGVRFGGLSVYDSGSQVGATGSLFWDSQNNNWVYQQVTGSTYTGGMLISGPRNTGGLGNEAGTTSGSLMKGQGGDHVTSSAIFEDGYKATFYGTSLVVSSSGFVGIGISTPSTLLSLGAAALAQKFLLWDNNDNNKYGLGIQNYEFRQFTPSNASITFGQVSTSDGSTFIERLRITGSKVGIGTNNPTHPLTVSGSIKSFGNQVDLILNSTSASEYSRLSFEENGTDKAQVQYINSTFGSPRQGRLEMANASSGGQGIAFITALGSYTSPQMFISTAGNVGIGTTSPSGIFQAGVANSGIYFDTSTQYTPKIIAAGTISDIQIQSVGNGGNVYINAPGTTSLINFQVNGAERMRIASTGNVGIGSTNPSYKLDIGGTSAAVLGFSSTGASSYSEIYFNRNTTTTMGYIGVGVNSTVSAAGDDFVIQNSLSSGNIVFRSNSGTMAERMRITAAGQILIHSTAYNSCIVGQLFGNDGDTYFTTNSTPVLYLNRVSTDGILLYFQKGCVQTGYISTNTYSLPSDLNFKKNISNLDLGLNLITKLRPVSYNHKIDDTDAALSTGFIAQELEQSLTELGVEKNKYYILQHKPNEDKSESEYWMDYTKIIPVLTKAIQELKATNDDLQAQINELKER